MLNARRTYQGHSVLLERRHVTLSWYVLKLLTSLYWHSLFIQLKLYNIPGMISSKHQALEKKYCIDPVRYTGYFRCYCHFQVELFIFISLHSSQLPVRSGSFSNAVNAITWCHRLFCFTLHYKILLSLISRILGWPYWVHSGYHDHGRLCLEMNYTVLRNKQCWALAGEMERWGELENNDAYGKHSLCSSLGRCSTVGS